MAFTTSKIIIFTFEVRNLHIYSNKSMQQQVWRPTKHGEKVLNSKFISSKNLAKTPKIMQMYKNAKIKFHKLPLF